jgi:predicted Zn-dependent protease
MRRLPLAPLSTLLAAGLVAGISCARNPVTGKNELSLVSESQEIALGKESAAQVQQSIGFYDDPGVQAYVSEIGLRMAKASERPDLPWEFHVVNDASVNAFALPGGFIYVTRGLMTSINDEAELATVVGHEIGHVTNRHSVQQISKQQGSRARGSGCCSSSTAATPRTRPTRRAFATRSTRTTTCAR